MGEEGGFGPAAWVRAAVVVGRLAEQRAGLKLGRLDQQEVRRRASRQLGRPISGDDPGLRVLLADLAQAPLTPLGRVWLRSELIRREVTQARLRDEVRRRPGLLATPLPRPLLVVVGLSRTGTTLLHTLLGCDPQALVVPFWQLRRPYPVHRDGWSGRPGSCGRRPWQDWPGRWRRGCGISIRSRRCARRRTSSCSATPACSPCRWRHPATWAGCRRPTRPRRTGPTVGTCRRCYRIGPGGGRC
jgi:sulfotransferase family protein